jgi:hypothetical protein
VAAAMFLVGCGNKSSSSSQPANQTTAAPPAATNSSPSSANYLGTLVAAQQSADKKIDTAYLNQAIQQYNVDQGHNPKTLQELVPNYVAKLPNPPNGYLLKYDANSGTVTVVPQQ